MPTIARTAAVKPRRKPAATPQYQATVIAAVTGVVDEVGDVIHPGVFTPALRKRWPKAVFHHEMKDFVGRITKAEEWMPGDPRLPKKQPNGNPWPAEAGALVVTIQFNPRVERSREVWEWARFYAESGEAAWSIGYIVPPGMSAKRNGVRHIYGIDLFEVSLVLHGAHPLTMALEVKSAAAAVEAARTMEYKNAAFTVPALGGGDELDGDLDDVEPLRRSQQVETKGGGHDSDVMVALYPDADTAGRLAIPGGENPDDLHVTLAYLGEHGGQFEPADVVAAVQQALAGHSAPLAGQVGGLGVFPAEGPGTPVWAPVDVPGLEKVRESVVDAIDAHPKLGGRVARDHGYQPHMTLGYDLPQVSPVAPTPVQFGEVVVVYGNDRHPVPFGGATLSPDLPPIEKKAAAAVAAARSLPPVEVKSMPSLPGSFEERQRLLDAALTAKLCTKRKKSDGLAESYHQWQCPEATFDTYVVTTVREDGEESHTYQVPYTWDGREITLGDPVEVELAVVPVAGAAPAEVPPDVERGLEPTLGHLEVAAQALSVLPIEQKQYERLRPRLLDLIDALYTKGVDVAGLALGDDVDSLDAQSEPHPNEPALPDPVDPDEEDEDESDPYYEEEPDAEPDADPAEDRVILDPDEVRRELDEL